MNELRGMYDEIEREREREREREEKREIEREREEKTEIYIKSDITMKQRLYNVHVVGY